MPRLSILAVLGLAVLIAASITHASSDNFQVRSVLSSKLQGSTSDLLAQGRETFRFDTFGDQDFWGGTLQLHKAVEGARFGGVGPGISPRLALQLGLKVDVDALPPSLREDLKNGKVNLDDPAVTLALLKLNSVVGLTGYPDTSGGLKSIGIQCALCHSTVDDSLLPGIGHRLDGWANRD